MKKVRRNKLHYLRLSNIFSSFYLPLMAIEGVVILMALCGIAKSSHSMTMVSSILCMIVGALQVTLSALSRHYYKLADKEQNDK